MAIVFLALACAAATNAQKKPPSPPPPGFEVLWTHPLETPAPAEHAPFLTVGSSSVFLVSAASDLTSYGMDAGTPRWTSGAKSGIPAAVAGAHVGVVAGFRFWSRFFPRELRVLTQDSGADVWRAVVPPDTTAVFDFQDRFGILAGTDMIAWTASGEPAWTRALGGHATTPVILAKGLLVVGVDEPALVVLDPATGQIRWRVHLPTVPESLGGTDDRLYFGGADSALYSYQTIAGPNWAFRYPRRGARAGTIGQPVVDKDQVYFALKDNSIAALNRNGGSQRWVHGLDARPVTGPILLGDSVAVAMYGGEVIEITTKDGSVRKPRTPAALPAVSLQTAAPSRDRTSIFTITTATDESKSLTAWGRPAATGRH